MPRAAAVIRYHGSRGVVWRIKYADADGRQVQETIGRAADGVTRRAAEAALRARLVRVEQGRWRKPAPITLREYGERWLERGRAKRQWKPASVAAYENRLGHLCGLLGARPVASIRPRDVAAYVDHALETGLSARTVNTHLNLLYDVMQAALADEYVQANPVVGVERPRAKRQRWRILGPADVPRLSRAFTDDRARRVFLTFILTGMRRSELVSLRWGHVNLVERTLRVVESKSEAGERLIALPEPLALELEQHYRTSSYRTDADYVFCHPEKGSRLDVDWFRLAFARARERAGIEGRVRVHDLRHAALTNMAAAGASPLAIMGTAGHRSMQTTRQYVHLAGVVFRDDAALLADRLLGVQTSGTNQPETASLRGTG